MNSIRDLQYSDGERTCPILLSFPKLTYALRMRLYTRHMRNALVSSSPTVWQPLENQLSSTRREFDAAVANRDALINALTPANRHLRACRALRTATRRNLTGGSVLGAERG